MKHILETTLILTMFVMFIGIVIGFVILFIGQVREAINYWEGWESVFRIAFTLTLALIWICITLYLLLYP